MQEDLISSDSIGEYEEDKTFSIPLILNKEDRSLYGYLDKE